MQETKLENVIKVIFLRKTKKKHLTNSHKMLKLWEVFDTRLRVVNNEHMIPESVVPVNSGNFSIYKTSKTARDIASATI